MEKQIFDEDRIAETGCGIEESEEPSVNTFSKEIINECFNFLFEKFENTEYEESIINLLNAFNYNSNSLQILEYQNLFLQDRTEKLKTNIKELKSIVESVFTNPEDSHKWISLGHEYRDYSLDKDSIMPYICYKKATELSNNDPYPCYLLAECYEKGAGTEKNLEKAFEYYSLAAKDEHYFYLEKLADCYKNGIGTTIDEDKAHELHEKAKALSYEAYIQKQKKTFEGLKNKLTEINKKNIKSWLALGDCYKNGMGTEKDLEKATDCYNKILEYYEQEKTFDKNYHIVLKRVKEIKNGSISKQEQILKLEKELTEVTQQNVTSWISLGDLYRKLKKKNYEKAYECYKKVFNYFEQTKEYDENYRHTLKSLLVCFDKEIGSETEEERNAIRDKLYDYDIEKITAKGHF